MAMSGDSSAKSGRGPFREVLIERGLSMRPLLSEVRFL